MARFSERYGHSTPRVAIQVHGIDEALVNRLWNVLKLNIFDPFQSEILSLSASVPSDRLVIALWSDYKKLNLDRLSPAHTIAYGQVRDCFLGHEWYQQYDFIEFIITWFNDGAFKNSLRLELNKVLEEELADSRIVGDLVTPIISDSEIASIEAAMTS